MMSVCLEGLCKFESTLQQDEERLAKGGLSYNQTNILRLMAGEKKILHNMIMGAERCLQLLAPEMTLKQARKLVSEFDNFELCDHYVDIVVFPLLKQQEGLG